MNFKLFIHLPILKRESKRPLAWLLVNTVFFIFLSFLTFGLSAQITLSGKVNTSDGDSREGTTISIPQLQKNAITDSNGEFVFRDLPKQTVILQIRRVGYQSISDTLQLNQDTYVRYSLIIADQVLEEVVVTDQSDSYRTSENQLGPFGKISPKDVPFSVNSTARSLFENRGVHSMADALQTNPTVAILMSSNTYSSMSRMMVRGFSAADQSELRDGLTDRSFTYVPLENVERIEVMNGLSGFLYGFSSIGGTVNYVSKEPTITPIANISLGTYGGGINYLHADLGGRANRNGKMGYRINAYRESGSTYIKDSDQARTFMSALLDYEVAKGTKVKADIYHQSLDMNGLQSYFAVPSSFTKLPEAFDPTRLYGQSWTHNESQKMVAGISMESQLSENINLRVAHRYGDMWRDYSYVSATFLDQEGNYEEICRTSPTQLETTHSTYALMDASFSTFQIKHQLTFGYTGTHLDYQRGVNVSNSLGTSNIESPSEYNTPIYANGLTTYFEQKMRNYLIGDRISFTDRWSMMLGVSYAEIVQNAGGLYTGISTSNFTQSKVTPSLALSYEPVKATSLYLSYMQGLSTGGTAPNTASNASKILSPGVSEQFETGVKTTLSKVDLSVALFSIDKVNEYIDPADNVYKQDGREIHQGIETTFNGRISESLLIIGGFTFMDAQMKKASNSPEIEGKTPVNVPQNQARLYLEYSLPFAENLVLSSSANYFGERAANNINSLNLPGVTTFDAGIRYKTNLLRSPAAVIVNVSNILNKNYWVNYRVGDGLQLGTPRVLSLTIKKEL